MVRSAATLLLALAVPVVALWFWAGENKTAAEADRSSAPPTETASADKAPAAVTRSPARLLENEGAPRAELPPSIIAESEPPAPASGRPSPRRYRRHVERYAEAIKNGEIPASASDLTDQEREKARADFTAALAKQLQEMNP